MSTFVDSFDDSGVPEVVSPGHFGSTSHDNSEGYVGYDSQQFRSFVPHDDVFVADPARIYGASGDFAAAVENGSGGFDGDLDGSNGPVLPPPSEMEEVGFALREWRRENALRLEEKEQKEKELLGKIIEEAEEYKIEFHKKREVTCESNKAVNREMEKLFVAKKEKFHAEADKDYWKSIAELVPNEVPAIEKKKKAKKDQENKPSIIVVQGPKPGKPTELSRMRHILVQLKHNTPPHLKLTPPSAPAKDPKASNASAPTTSTDAPVPKAPEPLAVA